MIIIGVEKEKVKLTLREIGLKRLVVIFLCGVVLIIISFSEIFSKGSNSGSLTKNEEKEGTTNIETDEVTSLSSSREYADELEGRLNKLLANVNGIGKTQVMITLKESGEQVVLKDEPYTKEESSGVVKDDSEESYSVDQETVLIEDDEGTKPYVVKETQPQVEGIVVIAEGGDDLVIANEIIEAVQVLFDVPVHKIKVMTMKK